MDETPAKPALQGSQDDALDSQNDNLGIPYELHHTQELHHCETSSSALQSKSTDDTSEINRAPSSSGGTNPNAPPTTAHESDTTTFSKTVHGYFTAQHDDDDDDYNASCNYSLDYPTDEQTLNTLNSLNSYHKAMFGMDDAPSNHHHRHSASSNTVERSSFDRPPVVKSSPVVKSPIAENDKDDESRNSSANDSMENNVRQQSNKTRPNRFRILEMAKKRMGIIHSKKSLGSSSGDDTAVDPVVVGKALGSDTAVVVASRDVHSDPPSESSFLGDAIVENVSSSSSPCPSQQHHHRNSDESTLPSYNIHASNLSQSTMMSSSYNTNRGLKNAFANVGGDTIGYSSAERWNPNQRRKSSFLEGADVEDHIVPSSQQPGQFVNNKKSDESLPSYNVHASTLSQSTKTASTVPNAFVNMGGDSSIYASPKSIENVVNVSFESAASPSTVVASGSRPLAAPSETGTGDASKSGQSMPDSSAREPYKSTLLADGGPLDSRVPSVTSLDDMILHDSNMAVKSLGASNAAKDNSRPRQHVVQAAAITPVRRNAANSSQQSIESYSFDRAYVNSDNVTFDPELSLPITSNENPDASNFHEDYSFCPSSKYSTFSTLTDEYRSYYDVSRRTGGIRTSVNEGDAADDPELPRSSSGPVDLDTNQIISANDNESFQSSFVYPPSASSQSDAQSWVFRYGNSNHLSRIIQYPSVDAGDGGSGTNGEGYVDEEAAMRYASLHQSSRRGCMSKVLIWTAVVLLAVSLAAVTLGVLLQKDDNTSSLLGRPASTNEGGSSVNASIPSPAAPELIFEQPTAAPKQSTPIADIISALDTEQPSIGDIVPSRSPSSTLKLPIDEVIETGVPSFQPTDILTADPTASPTTKRPTSRPTPQPNKQTPSPSAYSQTITGEKVYTSVIKVSRDTYIQSTESTRNYGSSDFLRAYQDPRSIVVLAFEVNPNNNLIQSSKRHYDTSNENQSHRHAQNAPMNVQVREAKLRLYSLEESETDGEVRGLTNAKKWKESDLTWDNARSEVSASGEIYVTSIDEAIDEYVWYEVDVTSAFDCCVETVGEMDLNLLIETNSSDGVNFASKEYESGEYAPELILSYTVEIEY